MKLMGEGTPGGHKGPPADSADCSANELADAYLNFESDTVSIEYADRCRNEAYRLLALVTDEERNDGEDVPDDLTSDMMFAGYAIAADEFREITQHTNARQARSTVVKDYDFHPTEVFLGISLILFDADERPPFLNNMTRYLMARHSWGDLPALYFKILIPTVMEFAHLPEKGELDPKLLNQAAEYATAVCEVTTDVFTKLKDLPYHPSGPITRQLWNGLREVMRKIKGLSEDYSASENEIEALEAITRRGAILKNVKVDP